MLFRPSDFTIRCYFDLWTFRSYVLIWDFSILINFVFELFLPVDISPNIISTLDISYQCHCDLQVSFWITSPLGLLHFCNFDLRTYRSYFILTFGLFGMFIRLWTFSYYLTSTLRLFDSLTYWLLDFSIFWRFAKQYFFFNFCTSRSRSLRPSSFPVLFFQPSNFSVLPFRPSDFSIPFNFHLSTFRSCLFDFGL